MHMGSLGRVLLTAGAATIALGAFATAGAASTSSASRSGLSQRTRAAAPTTAGTLVAQLGPSVPKDPMVRGTKPGGLPWKLSSGEALLSSNGTAVVELRGFLIPKKGRGPVKTVMASLSCAGSQRPAATTKKAVLSSRGNATIVGSLQLPASCLAPVVLVNPNGLTGTYIASSRLPSRSSVLLRSALTGSSPGGPTIGGEKPAGKPWVLHGGSAVVLSNGTAVVHVDRLLIPSSGTVGTVHHVSVSLVCAGRRKPAAHSKQVELGKDGTATLVAALTLPSRCDAPIVLVNPNGSRGVYIAAGGARGASASAGAVVAVRKTSLGTILVDRTGRTLYLFRKDKRDSGASACRGACAGVWPPLTTSGAPTAGIGARSGLLGTLTRKDGSKQVTYDGWPLYRYAGDVKPGQTRGEGLRQFGARWYAVSPAGTQVRKSSGSNSGYGGY